MMFPCAELTQSPPVELEGDSLSSLTISQLLHYLIVSVYTCSEAFEGDYISNILLFVIPFSYFYFAPLFCIL